MAQEIVKMNLRDLVNQSENCTHSGSEYKIDCPICKQLGHNYYKKQKLYIKDDFSVGFCFRCGTKFLNKFDISKDSLDFLLNTSKPKPKEYKEEKIDTSLYDNASNYNNEGIRYLGSRRLWLKEHFNDLGLRFLNDRLIIPFFKDGDRNGEVMFYQCRFYDPERSGKRYFIPPSTNKPIYIPPISNKSSDTIVLCEGPFGAIAISNKYPEYKCGAVMGSNISDYQLYLLSKMNIKNFILYFDEDKINKKAKKVLSTRFPFCNYTLITSPLGDPEDDLVSNKMPLLDISGSSSGLSDSVMNFFSEAKRDLTTNRLPYGKSNKKNKIEF